MQNVNTKNSCIGALDIPLSGRFDNFALLANKKKDREIDGHDLYIRINTQTICHLTVSLVCRLPVRVQLEILFYKLQYN